MTDTITLRRAAEQARDALESLCRHDRHDALAALDAALAEPDAKPSPDAIARAVEAEREACARVVDHIMKAGGGTYGDAIRARGSK